MAGWRNLNATEICRSVYHLNHYHDMIKVQNTKTTNSNSNINIDLRV